MKFRKYLIEQTNLLLSSVSFRGILICIEVNDIAKGVSDSFDYFSGHVGILILASLSSQVNLDCNITVCLYAHAYMSICTRAVPILLSYFVMLFIYIKRRDNLVGIATRVRFPGGGGGGEFFSSPPCPERIWGLPSLLSNGYQGLFPWG
jgi:hypothetical protein